MDSLEFLSAFALLSGMTPEEKIRCKCKIRGGISFAFIHLLYI